MKKNQAVISLAIVLFLLLPLSLHLIQAKTLYVSGDSQVVEKSLFEKIGSFFSLVFASITGRATIEVPADYATIQAAVNAAGNGDTINVAAGPYNENVSIFGTNKSNIVLEAQSGVTLNGGFIIYNNATGVTIQGFTINRGGAVSGHCASLMGGICVGSGKGTKIIGNTFTNMSTKAGASIEISVAEQPLYIRNDNILIENNIFHSNLPSGSAIYANYNENLVIRNNTFYTGMTLEHKNALVEYNTFHNKGFSQEAGTKSSGMIVRYNNFDIILGSGNRSLTWYGGNVSTGNILAENNYWNSANGPYDNNGTTEVESGFVDAGYDIKNLLPAEDLGSAVDDFGGSFPHGTIHIDYYPWLCEAYPTSWVTINGSCTVPCTPCTTDCYVNANNGSDSNCGNIGDPFKTILKAVYTVTNVSGTIHVAAGTYNESISLGRVGHTNCQNLTLLGAKSGVAAGVNKVPGTRGTGESVINGAFQTGHDGSGCNGAIIDGFTINGLSSSQGVLLGSSNNPTLNATVKNNILTCAGGQALTMSQSSNGATVLENDMRSTRAGSSVVFVNPSSGHLIEYNYIHDSGAGIGTSSVGNTQVRYNKFYNISDLQWGEAFGGDTFGTGVIVQYNNFDNVLRAMRNFGGSSNAVDVTNNWWGNQAGPNVCSWNDINHNWLDGFATPADIGEMNCSGAAGNPLVYGNALTPASIMPTYAEFLCEPYPTSWVSVGGVCIVGNNVTGNSSDVETTGIVLTNVTINGTQSNSSQTYSGEQNVSLLSGSTIVLEFPFNFSNASLDLSNINITLGADYIIVNMSGVIQPGFTKTVYFDDNGYDNLCVKDADIVSISEISAACNGASEIDISQCLTAGTYTANGISCTKTGTTLKIENLTHSAVLGTKNAVTSAVTGGGGSTGLVKI